VTPYLHQRSLIGTPASACLSAPTPASSVKRGPHWTLLLGTCARRASSTAWSTEPRWFRPFATVALKRYALCSNGFGQL